MELVKLPEKKAVQPSPAAETVTAKSTDQQESKDSKKVDSVPAPEKSAEVKPLSPAKETTIKREPSPARMPKAESPAKDVRSRSPSASPSRAALEQPKPSEVAAKVEPSSTHVAPVQVAARPASPQKETKSAPASETAPAKAVEPKKRMVYARDFLLSFRSSCLTKPSNLPVMEAIIGEDLGSGGLGSASAAASAARRRSTKDRMSTDNNRAGRYSDIGPPRQSSARNSRPPPGFTGGNKPGPPPPGYPSGGRQSLGGPGRKSGGGGGGGGGGGRGSRGGHPPQPEVHQEPMPVLEKSENRWVPASVLHGPSKTATDETEAVCKQVRGLLNKLTLEKFDSISKKMLDLPLKNMEVLLAVIDLIFDKAVEETRFADMYAQLCHRMAMSLPDFPAGKNKIIGALLTFADYVDQLIAEQGGDDDRYALKNLFRRMLLSTCQREFEKKAEWSMNPEDRKRVTDDMAQEEVDQITAEEATRRKLKRRTLGNIHFIGALFKLNMLSEKIMHECVRHLLRDIAHPEEEEMESVCDLMNRVGIKLDRPAAKAYVDAYFERLQALSAHEELSSRVRFKILDIIELRERNWTERERQLVLNAGPMTLDEIYQAAEEKKKEDRRKTMSSRESARPSSGRKDDRRASRPNRPERGSGPAEDWNGKLLPGGRKGRAEPPFADSKRSVMDSKNVTVGPGTAGLNRGAKGWTEAKGELRRNESEMSESAIGRKTKTPSRSSSVERVDSTQQNAFDLLANEEGHPENDHGGSDDEQHDIVSPTDTDTLVDWKKNVLSAKELDTFVQKKLTEEFVTACDDSVVEGAKILLKLRSFVNDESMDDITLKGLGRLIEDLSKEALKISAKSSRNRVENLGNAVVLLVTSDVVAGETITGFFKDLICGMTDTILDCPGFEVCLGVVMGCCVLANLCQMTFVKQALLELADVMGDYTPRVVKKPGFTFKPSPPAAANFVATLLKTIQSLEGDTALKEVWARYVCEEDVREWSEDATDQVLATVTMSQLSFPWWGTDKKKLEDIPEEAILSLLKDASLLACICPTLQLTFGIKNILEPELSKPASPVAVQKMVDYIVSFDANSKSSPRFVFSMTELLLRHAQQVAVGTPSDDQPPSRELEKSTLEKWLPPVLKPLVHPSGPDSKLKFTLQSEVLWATQHVCSTGLLKNDGMNVTG